MDLVFWRHADAEDGANDGARKLTSKGVKQAARMAELLEAAGWPDAKRTVVLVGHQPSIGQAVALALTGTASEWRVKKGAIWWISLDEGDSGPAVRAVLSPDML